MPASIGYAFVMRHCMCAPHSIGQSDGHANSCLVHASADAHTTPPPLFPFAHVQVPVQPAAPERLRQRDGEWGAELSQAPREFPPDKLACLCRQPNRAGWPQVPCMHACIENMHASDGQALLLNACQNSRWQFREDNTLSQPRQPQERPTCMGPSCMK
eukprot:1156584-Pelagomonas_calceolata.AAC.6